MINLSMKFIAPIINALLFSSALVEIFVRYRRDNTPCGSAGSCMGVGVQSFVYTILLTPLLWIIFLLCFYFLRFKLPKLQYVCGIIGIIIHIISFFTIHTVFKIPF